MYIVASGDWTTALTAVATVALAFFTMLLVVGVFFAAVQFFQDGRFNRALQTSYLLDQWNLDLLRRFRSQLDHSSDYDANKLRAEQTYYALRNGPGSTPDWDDCIQRTADIAERMKLFIEKRLADRGMIYEHIGYGILSTYYYLQDILKKRTYEEDFLYDAFRELAMMTQAYAKKHPDRMDIRKQLVCAEFPELVSRLDEATEAKAPPSAGDLKQGA
jgi:hypothetical protein